MRVFTPSTGKTRTFGDPRWNALKIETGERVLARLSLGGWLVGSVIGIAELGVTLRLPKGELQTINVEWRELAGVVPEGANADDLIAKVVALEERGDEGIAKARRAKWDTMRKQLDHDLHRSNSFIPGQ